MSHKYHVFVCTQQRPEGHPRGCCTSRGGGVPFFDRLVELMTQRGLWDRGVSAAQTSCLGFCKFGPEMVVYPEGVWYKPVVLDDIDEIVQSHLTDGKPVERLRIYPAK